MGDYFVSHASLTRNIHSLFAGNTACIFNIPADTFKCFQLNALNINKCRYTLNLVGSLVAKNLGGEKSA